MPPQDNLKHFKIDVANALALNDLRPGDHLTDYGKTDLEIWRVARGGFGLVFLGFDRARGGPNALKTLRPELLASVADHDQLAALFVREAMVWVGLWPHANLLTAQTVTRINGMPFLVLDYATRRSLRDWIEQPNWRGRPLLLQDALLIAQQIAAGLVALHTPDPEHLRDTPLVHRDLKPENILMDEQGYAMITDFGLTKVALDAEIPAGAMADGLQSPREQNTRAQRYQTMRGVALGTPAYMAPEQWEDASTAGPPADMYAFGLMLSELFAGRGALLDLDRHYSKETWRNVHVSGIPRSLREVASHVPSTVEALYQGLLFKRAEVRPMAAEVLAILQDAAHAADVDPYIPSEAIPHTAEYEGIFWEHRASAHTRLGLNEEALEYIGHALAWCPGHYRMLLNRGTIFYSLGRYEEASADYDAALAAVPLSDVEVHTFIYQQRGALFSRMQQYPEAESAFAEALVLRPKNADIWYNRSLNQHNWIQVAIEDEQWKAVREHAIRALEFAQRALALNPQHPEYIKCVAVARQLLTEFEQMLGRQ